MEKNKFINGKKKLHTHFSFQFGVHHDKQTKKRKNVKVTDRNGFVIEKKTGFCQRPVGNLIC
jgi:hypothetical protein